MDVGMSICVDAGDGVDVVDVEDDLCILNAINS